MYHFIKLSLKHFFLSRLLVAVVVGKTKYTTIQIIIYKSNQLSSHRKAEKIRLSEFSPGGCRKGSEVEYSIGIVVPSVPPTDLTASSVCRVKYEILVSGVRVCIYYLVNTI